MGQHQFEEWIKQEQPQITDIQRYPRTIRTISNHLESKGVAEYDLYLIKDVSKAKKIKEIYFSIYCQDINA